MALQYAVSGGCRAANTRSHYLSSTASFVINGTDRTRFVSKYECEIVDVQNETPNTASIVVRGFTPTVGMQVTIKQGSEKLFDGIATTVEPLQRRTGDRVRYRLDCIDWSVLLDRRLVNKSYSSTAADLIANDILATYTSGFTTTNVQVNLTAVDLPNKMETVSQALTRLANLIGAFWYIDYNKDLHFRTAENSTNPTSLTTSNHSFKKLRYRKAIDQIRTRVYVEGLGSVTTNNVGSSASSTGGVSAGGTSMSVEDSSSFSASGGSVVTEDGQIITYTGVTNLAAPASAPTVALGYSSTTKSATFTRSGTTVTASVTSHGYATGATVWVTAGSPTDYNGRYTITVVDASTFTFQIGGSPANGSGTVQVATSGYLSGTYTYKVTFAGPTGETLASTASSSVSPATVANDNATFSVTPTTGGSLTPSTVYRHGGTAVTALGETALIFERTANLGAGDSAVIIGSANDWKVAPYDDPRIVSKRVYRRKNSETYPQDCKLAVTVDVAVGTYTDKAADGTLGQAALTENRAGGGGVMLTGLPTSGDARVTMRKIYRKESAESAWKLVATITDNTTTTYTDTLAAANLGAVEPAVSTFPGLLTGIPASGAGSITTAIPNGGAINLIVQRDDTTAQTTLAGLEGGDGIHEHYIQDRRLGLTAANARGDAELTLGKDPDETITVVSEDLNVFSGRTLTVNIGSISTTAKIQRVRFFWTPGRAKVQREITATNRFKSLYEYLRDLQDKAIKVA